MRYRYFTLPSSQSLRQCRLLKPFDRFLHHHSLWQFNRRTVPGALAAGLFSGLILPLGQIGLAALAAVVFRVNLPVAAVSTLVTNPLTVGPIYYAAYKTGHLLTASAGGAPARDAAAQPTELISHGMRLAEWIHAVGLPLALGLGAFALGAAATGYILVSGVWRWRVRRRWARRKQRGAARRRANEASAGRP